jgi:hypothetical protein
MFGSLGRRIIRCGKGVGVDLGVRMCVQGFAWRAFLGGERAGCRMEKLIGSGNHSVV